MDKKRIVLFRISDLLIRSKIELIASGRLEILNVSTVKEATDALTYGTILICDLTNASEELDDVVRVSRHLDAKVLGFYPHVRTEIRRIALEKGVDYIVPRSALEARLRELADKED